MMLTRGELLNIYRKFDNPKKDRDSVIDAMAAAVDAAMVKLAEQEPVAWIGLDTATERTYFLENKEDMLSTTKVERIKVTPLYAHPMPSSQGFFDSSNHIADKRKMVLDGYELVPVEADQALLISMACCLNHGFGLLDKEAQDSMLHDMENLYKEIVGAGYYSQENRERYLAMLADEPKLGERE